MTYNVFGGN